MDNYLKILPESQRQEITEFLVRNADFKQSVVSAEGFNRLLEQVTKQRKQLTEYAPQNEKLDSENYNDFNARLYGDLNYSMSEVDMLEKAIINYGTLNGASINAMQNEINALSARVKSLKLVLFESPNTIATTEQFNNKSSLDQDESLYLDRDSTPLKPVEFRQVGSRYELTMQLIAPNGDGTVVVPDPIEAKIESSKVITPTGCDIDYILSSNLNGTSERLLNSFKLPDGTSLSHANDWCYLEVALKDTVECSSITVEAAGENQNFKILKIFVYDNDLKYTSPLLGNTNIAFEPNAVMNIEATPLKKIGIYILYKGSVIENESTEGDNSGGSYGGTEVRITKEMEVEINDPSAVPGTIDYHGTMTNNFEFTLWAIGNPTFVRETNGEVVQETGDTYGMKTIPWDKTVTPSEAVSAFLSQHGSDRDFHMRDDEGWQYYGAWDGGMWDVVQGSYIIDDPQPPYDNMQLMMNQIQIKVKNSSGYIFSQEYGAMIHWNENYSEPI